MTTKSHEVMLKLFFVLQGDKTLEAQNFEERVRNTIHITPPRVCTEAVEESWRALEQASLDVVISAPIHLRVTQQRKRNPEPYNSNTTMQVLRKKLTASEDPCHQSGLDTPV